MQFVFEPSNAVGSDPAVELVVICRVETRFRHLPLRYSPRFCGDVADPLQESPVGSADVPPTLVIVAKRVDLDSFGTEFRSRPNAV